MVSLNPLQQFNEIPASTKRFFCRQIIIWFDENKRLLPWRDTDNPYHILVAEILLQQTDAKKVSLIYPGFIERYPTTAALMRAEKGELDGFISNIGLNYRAERLLTMACEIEDKYGGQVPCSEYELMSLPGVGRYVANAVLSAAFSMRVAVVDTNIIRIFGRFFGIYSQRSRPRSDPDMWSVAHELLPRKAAKCRSWNYAMLDFCALVCKFYNPRCSDCVCAKRCRWFLMR
jgi:A/G-specific adenine glycosylase